MRSSLFLASALSTSIVIAAPAHAGDEVTLTPAPAWVVQHEPAPVPDAADAVQLLLKDVQVFNEDDVERVYTRQVVRLGSPEGLRNATVRMEWDPKQQDMFVHHLRVVRGEEVFDILEHQEFTIMRRETQLEKATLNGRLTGLIQPEGIEVGDIIDFAYTVEKRDAVVQGRMGSWLRLGDPGEHGVAYLSYRHPEDREVALKRWPMTAEPEISRSNGYERVSWKLTHVDEVDLPVYAPSRFKILRYAEYSDYRDWSEVADQLRPHFDATAVIEPGSRLEAEAVKIAAATDDPIARAEMALDLVQSRVRYVNLALGAGGLVPADAETTWRRRYGDCKGKTVLLMALLDHLGIDAVPALVKSTGDDALAERLPAITHFDHVMVRATIDGREYWLDGTRNGDARLALIEVPDMDYALPLVENADLVSLDIAPLALPKSETHIVLDMSAGFFEPATAKMDIVVRGADATIVERNWDQVESMIMEELEKELDEEAEFEFVERVYDEEAQTLTLRADVFPAEPSYGYGIGDGVEDPTFFVPDEREDVDINEDAPFSLKHPSYELNTMTYILPEGGTSLIAPVGADAVYAINGERFERRVMIEEDRIIIRTEERSLTDELDYHQALDNADTAEAYNRDVFYANPRFWNLPADQLEALLEAADHLETKELDEDEERDEYTILAMRHGAALGFLRRGDAERAERLFDELREQAAGADDLNHLCWNKAISNMAIERALEECNAAVSAQRDSADVFDSRALVHFRRGAFEEAIADYDRAIAEVDAQGIKAHMQYGRGLANLALGRTEEARRDMDEALAEHPGIAARYHSYGVSEETALSARAETGRSAEAAGTVDGA